MKIRIWHKLALILIITMVFVISAAFILAQINFRHDFSDYLLNHEKRFVQSLSDELVRIYERDQSWRSLQDNPRAWHRLMRGHIRNISERHVLDDERAPGDLASKPEEFIEHMKEFDRDFRPPTGRNKPEHDTPSFNKRRFKGPKGARHILLDQDKNPVVGQIFHPSKTQDYPIVFNETTIGYLRVKSVTDFTDKLDQRFIQSQQRAYIAIAICAVLISLLVASMLALYFRRRISKLTSIANDLSVGNYDQRMTVNGHDELSELGARFNALAETLEKNRDAQKAWVADISHELRTPLTILSGEIEALQDGVRSLDQKAVDSLAKETAYLSRLVDDLYQLALSDQGKLDYQKNSLNLNLLIEQISTNYLDQFSKKNINFVSNLDQNNDLIMLADQQRLTQMLINLLDNSLKYTDTDGMVRISTSLNANQIQLIIEDSSPGISEDQHERIFDRLFRVESSRNRKQGGAGLGLAIVHKIIEAHHGQVKASESELGGLKISILFPLEITNHV